MSVAWASIVIVLGLLGWLGQVITAVAPELGARLGVTERESDCDRVFWADVRGEAYWDSLTCWTLPLAGVLLLTGNVWWPVFGLVGGGMWLYFAGRGIAQRLALGRRGIAVGKPAMAKVYYGMLGVWGLVSLVTIAWAAASLSPAAGNS